MKKTNNAASLAVCCALTLSVLAGCAPASYESWQDEIRAKTSAGIKNTVKNTDTENRTWYEVFVYSFNDSDGDGIGDINGVTEMLDYIEYMGFSGIWLTPVHPSTTYHKYDVTDYFDIDPQYGTMEDFEKLLSECEKRGIAVIMDMIINHTSSKHEWFAEALKALRNGETDNKYIGYYNFAEEAGNGKWKNAANGWYYECQFWDEMPDLNLESAAVRAELEKVFTFWLNKGVSGFRLDAVKEYVTGNAEKNIEILSWLNGAVKTVKRDAYLVGEAWEANTGLYDYYSSGIDSFFNFNFAAAEGRIAKTLLLKDQTASSYIDALLTAQESINSKNPGSSDAPFFTNHDMARASGFLKRDAVLIKMAWGMSLTQSGNAFVYYGEEIGMSGSGKDENKRAPMYWTEKENGGGVTYGPPSMDTVKHGFPSALEQIGDESSILEYIRKAVILRNKYPEIAAGKITETEAIDSKVCRIVKQSDTGSVSLYYNFSGEEATVKSEKAPDDWLSASREKPAYENDGFVLPPYSIIIIKNS